MKRGMLLAGASVGCSAVALLAYALYSSAPSRAHRSVQKADDSLSREVARLRQEVESLKKAGTTIELRAPAPADEQAPHRAEPSEQPLTPEKRMEFAKIAAVQNKRIAHMPPRTTLYMLREGRAFPEVRQTEL